MTCTKSELVGMLTPLHTRDSISHRFQWERTKEASRSRKGFLQTQHQHALTAHTIQQTIFSDCAAVGAQNAHLHVRAARRSRRSAQQVVRKCRCMQASAHELPQQAIVPFVSTVHWNLQAGELISLLHGEVLTSQLRSSQTAAVQASSSPSMPADTGLLLAQPPTLTQRLLVAPSLKSRSNRATSHFHRA